MLVRILLKYIYFFVYGQSNQTVTSPTQQNFFNRLEEYKKSIVNTYLSQPMIRFFNTCFGQWPYDTSFRLVLETWLTFVQPWRYVDKPIHDSGDDSSSILISNEWLSFIHEEYFFYSTYFYQFLQRAERVDLGVDRNAALLYRVMKVFSNESFRQLLRSAEDRLRHGRIVSSPSLPFTSNRSGLLTQTITQFSENSESVLVTMPGGLRVLSLWSSLVTNEAEKLLNLIEIALKRLVDLTNADSFEVERVKEQRRSRRPWWSCLNDFFGLSGVPIYEWSRHEKEEREKCEYYLRQASENLRVIYQSRDGGSSLPVTPSRGFGDALTVTPEQTRFHYASTPVSDSNNPDCVQTPTGTSLTPHGRYQLITGQRRFRRFQFSDDPDLQPIRSFEIGILVKATQELSDYLTQRFQDNLRALCCRDGFWGRWARHMFLLDVPKSANLDNSLFSPISKRQLQLRREPRIRLRFLANKRLLLALVTAYILFYSILGVRSIPLFVILIGLVVFFSTMVQVLFTETSERR